MHPTMHKSGPTQSEQVALFIAAPGETGWSEDASNFNPKLTCLATAKPAPKGAAQPKPS